MRLSGRTILITGSTGIAAAAARGFASEGASVFVTSRSAEHCRELADSIEAAGGHAGWRTANLVEEEAVDEAVRTAVERFGRLDGVYGVAGISGRRFGDGPLHACTLAGWQTVLEANLRSQFLVCRAAVRQMLTQDPDAEGVRGAILTMSSALARRPAREHFETHAYAASKGGIEAFSRSIAAYYAPFGIRVNTIAPALVATPMSRRAQESPEIRRYLAEKQPLARGPIAPTDLVEAAILLLGPGGSMITGQVVTVDGGWSVSEPTIAAGAAAALR